tara:strand:- start:257 stop:526 length:270 start_codon:yes stop_codon:yes gene_type:complete
MNRPIRKNYINKETKVQLIADLEMYIDFLEACRDYDDSGENRPNGYILAKPSRQNDLKACCVESTTWNTNIKEGHKNEYCKCGNNILQQ